MICSAEMVDMTDDGWNGDQKITRNINKIIVQNCQKP